MQHSHLLTPFAHSLQQTELWMKDLLDEMGVDDTHKAYRALRATLHALRDRLIPTEAAHLAAQLPLVLRGLYYEGWNPKNAPSRDRAHGQFLARVAEQLLDTADFPPQDAARAVIAVLARHVSPGEIEDVRNMLPPDARALFP